MIKPPSRRALLKIVSLAAAFPFVRLPALADTQAVSPKSTPDSFPSYPAELAREVVTVSHFDLNRVRELVEARPSLARAAWDWGFGDYETALGAASHMGNRPIAEYLMAKGARPSLFSAAMLGQLEVVKAFVAAQPGVQRIDGPHGIPLLAHARAGGESAKGVFDFLKSLGDAGGTPDAELPDSERAQILGTYVFGVGASQQVDLTVDRMGDAEILSWTRKGTSGRPIHHVGNRVFYPAGAPHVRIRFVEDQGTMVMTVHDPDLVLTARRKPAAK